MNFGNKSLQELFHLTPDGFIACSGLSYKSLFRSVNQSATIFGSIINNFGILSAKSQALKQVITTFLKFTGTDQRIYIKVNLQTNQVQGFVKVGQKKLFYRDYLGSVIEITPTCVLDIYVHESCQRSGLGKDIFEKFLQSEKLMPQKLAYDRPSSKLISFLRKHYDLSQYIQQNNNFVIFEKYFNNHASQDEKSRKLKTIKYNYSPPIDSSNNCNYTVAEPNRQKRNSMQVLHVTDSLQILQKQVENMKLYKQNMTSQQKKAYDLSFRTPWAAKQQIINFRTTSNIYGNHYIR